MSDLEALIKKLDSEFKLSVDSKENSKMDLAASEILFHLPLISLVVLIISSHPKAELQVDDIAHWVTRVLMELYSNFVFSLQRLRFSSAIRKKSVEAIVFLESMEMIQVSGGNKHSISITEKGRKFINKYRSEGDEFSVLIGRIQSAVGRIETKGWSLL